MPTSICPDRVVAVERIGADALGAYQFFFDVLASLPAEVTGIRLTLGRAVQRMPSEQCEWM